MSETQNTATKGIQQIGLTLRGKPGSLLVVHAFAEKAKKEIRDKQQKKAKKAKEERKPQEECDAARYLDANGFECVPVTAIKKALVSAATAFDDLTKVALRQALFVAVANDPKSSLVPILTPNGQHAVGVMREDAVTIGINTRGLTYRPAYEEWQLNVVVEYNPRLISEEQLLALVDQAAGMALKALAIKLLTATSQYGKLLGNHRKEYPMTTRQWKWVQGRRERGLCEMCGDYSGDQRLCPDCREHSIKMQRKRRHNKPWEPGHRGRPTKFSSCDVRKRLRSHLSDAAEAIVLAIMMFAGIVLAHCM